MKLVERNAVRAILLTAQGEVLLMRIRNPVSLKEFWNCPGGGLEPGEGVTDGLKRELREELGLLHFEVSHEVHKRHHVFDWKEKRISQHETFFVVKTEKFEPVINDEEEKEVLREFRWWKIEDLQSAPDPVTPTRLQEIVTSYLREGPPKGPLKVETLTD
jgi:8-oxo-dGTP pyrophosphatase MutT (NUDIX family)